MTAGMPEPGYEANVPRLLAYRQAHPDVEVLYLGGYWQAILPEPNGLTVAVRYTLGDLLDKLESLNPGGSAT